MSIAPYLAPINPEIFGFRPTETAVTLGSHIDTYFDTFPAIPDSGLVLIGVGEDRGAENNAGCAKAPDHIRRCLYSLAAPCKEAHIADLGNLIEGQTAEDTYYALSEVAAEVLSHNCTLILLGGSQDLTYALYKAYANLNRIINISTIDARFDLEDNDIITSRTWMRNIIMSNPNYLFFHSNIGYQTYFVGQSYIELMDELKFDAYRLGEVQHNMKRAEALIRNADILSVDLGAVRQSDAPANSNPSPHGFYGEELCQMMRFAGMSDKTHCLGVFEFNPLYDNHQQTANMTAQAIWYFIEGFYTRKDDNPLVHPENCKNFRVAMEREGLEIIFHKSKLTDRWWVEVPCHDADLQELYTHQLMLPCTYSDYEQAMHGEFPQLWWRYYTRLNK